VNSPSVLWFTGLSGAGKTTIAEAVYRHLADQGQRVELLDGDQIRGLFPATGFSKQARNEHVRRVAFTASLLEKHGVTVIVSLISPYLESRQFARSLCRNFVEVFVSTPLSICEARDPKGLYKKARAGEIKEFTGIDDPYDKPENPEILLSGHLESPEVAATQVARYLNQLNPSRTTSVCSSTPS
jgi:adenylylsulfate kinase